jgi:hypothetical protein
MGQPRLPRGRGWPKNETKSTPSSSSSSSSSGSDGKKQEVDVVSECTSTTSIENDAVIKRPRAIGSSHLNLDISHASNSSFSDYRHHEDVDNCDYEDESFDDEVEFKTKLFIIDDKTPMIRGDANNCYKLHASSNSLSSYLSNHVSKSSQEGISIKSKAIEQLHISTGEVLRIYPSGKDAAEFMNVSQSGISLVCSGKIKDSYGFKWRFYEGPPIDCTCNIFK